jgi:hypothetical protein
VVEGMTEDVLATVTDAAETSQWFSGPPRWAVQLAAAAARTRQGQETKCPLELEEIKELLKLGEGVYPIIALWSNAYNATAAQVLAVLSDASVSGLSDTLRSVISARWLAWSPDERRLYFEASGRLFMSDGAGLSLFPANVPLISDGEITEILVTLFDSASNNDERERVMAMWEHFGPSDQTARRALVDGVFIPLINHGRGATSIALRHFSLVENPPTQAARERIKRALKESPLSDESQKVMRDAGWVRRRWRR